MKSELSERLQSRGGESTYVPKSVRADLQTYTILGLLLCALLVSGAASFGAQIILAWDPPAERLDGTPLSGLWGYKVYYGTSPGQYSQILTCGDTASTAVTGLDPGLVYYFAVSAVDGAGLESPLSAELAVDVTMMLTENHATPFSWLARHGITTNQEQVVGLDLDGDGKATWQEYILDSDPWDPDSHLVLESVELLGTQAGQAAGCILRWRCATTRVYDVQQKVNASGEEWQPVEGMTALVPASGLLTVTNAFDEAGAFRLFRVAARLPR